MNAWKEFTLPQKCPDPVRAIPQSSDKGFGVSLMQRVQGWTLD